MSASLGEDLSKALFETEEAKGYVNSVVQNIAPLLTALGFDAFVPFISPLIIAGLTSQLLPKAMKIAGGKIEIVDEELQRYKKEGGSKAIFAKVASPVVGVLKKVIPAPEEELYEALSGSSTKLKEFLSTILKDDSKRKVFEENLKKFLSGKYDDLDEFQREVKEIMGTNVDRLAVEAYLRFSAIIYNKDILDKVTTLEHISERDRKETREKFEGMHAEFNQQIGRALSEIEQILKRELTSDQFLSNGLDLVTAQTPAAKGDTDCWVKGHFKDGDIKAGYDARRPITDKIIGSVDKNVGTIVYGRPHYGKTMVLKRVMFELIERGICNHIL